MRDTLALKYRPTSFADISGQKVTKAVLQLMVSKGTLPTGMLFSGPKGSGKTTMARVLANAVNGNDELGYFEIDAASNGGVAEARKLIQSLTFQFDSNKKFIVIDEAHNLSSEAFNAMLKPLEEPPEDVIFILATTEPHKIPKTVQSRLIKFPFTAISNPEVIERLQYINVTEQLHLDDAVLANISETSEGSLRDAIMTADFVSRAGVRTWDSYVRLVGVTDYGPSILGAMLENDVPKMYSLVDEAYGKTNDIYTVTSALTSTLKDLAILMAGGSIWLSGESLDRRKAIASRLDAEAVVGALSVLWKTRTVKPMGDGKSLLDMTCMMVLRSLHKK